MPRRFVPATLLAALLRGTSLHAQQAQAIVQPASLGGLDSTTQVAIAQVIETARARGIPVEPLVQKARLGARSRVPGARIHASVAAYADQLVAARDALAPQPTSAEVEAGAQALAAGAPPQTLSRMRRASPSRSLVVPLGVLTQLVSNKVHPTRASVIVIDLLNKGAEPRHLLALSSSVQADIAAGIPLDNSLDLRLQGIIPTLPGNPGRPALTAQPGPNAPKPKP
jgi:hypothetical protein